MTTDKQRLIDDAEEILRIDVCESYGGRLAYQDDGMRTWYWITTEDLRLARDFAREDEDDPYYSAYSHWCAATSVREVESCETQLGLSLSCKCEREGRSRSRCANH